MTVPQEVQIRSAQLGDAPHIARVHAASLEAIYRGVLPDEVLSALTLEERTERWREWIRDPLVNTLVVDRGGRVAAFCTLRPCADADQDPSVVGELPTVYVHPGEWRQGLGRALCAAALELAHARGFSLVTLWVLELNERARRFYQGLGFRKDGAEKLDEEVKPIALRALRYSLAVSPALESRLQA